MFILILLALTTASNVTGQPDPFAVGNCGITRSAVTLARSDGTKGLEIPRDSFVKILKREKDQVEVALIPRLLWGCTYQNGVFAGWVRRRDMSREYRASASNRHDSVQPTEPAPIFDRPGGDEIGQTRKNDNLMVVSRRPDGWILMTRELGPLAPKGEDWIQPKGLLATDALEPFALADPLGPAGGDESPFFRRKPGLAPDGGEIVEVLGKQFSSRKLCNGESFEPSTFVTALAQAPLAFLCGPSHDSGSGPSLVTVFSADGTPHSERARREQTDEQEAVRLVRKSLSRFAAAVHKGPTSHARSSDARAR
jgi:hypothetical protein